MPISNDFPLPRRYNSLRLPGFDYSSVEATYFITMDTDESRPVCGDISLAKSIVAALISDQTAKRIRVVAYTLLPDHFHLLACVREAGVNLSAALGAFKSFTTQLYWKRGREIVTRQRVELPPESIERSRPEDEEKILQALVEWRLTLRPECVALKQQWPCAKPQRFLGKRLWHTKFYEHVIRNQIDFRETVEYIVMNPVKRGYVKLPEYYPFTGFGLPEGDWT